ncbi:MAG: ornithine cyclodeaminase family protein [Acidimicrobiia bacterium]|nr:ornithine cyclodeaminase family protein [Acidimicrobiia bacterium]
MVETLIITQDEVPALLPMSDCIQVVREALAALARDEGIQPLRPIMWLPEKVGALGMMPGYLADIDTLGIKTVTVFPGNAGTKYDSHQGSIMLFDGANGRLKAVIDATEITTIRTAAASAVATDVLARPDARVLAILGSGVQAGSHIDAMAAVRPIGEVRVWSRQPANADRLVALKAASGLTIRTVASVAEAVGGADIVCTTTASHDPVLTGDLLEPGMHINAVGSSVPFARELDTGVMTRSRLFVDRRESTLNEAGDFLIAQAEGAIDESHIVAEIGELLIGAAEGRGNDEEITLFKSLGLAVEDVAAGNLVYCNALAAGAGTRLVLGGLRHD